MRSGAVLVVSALALSLLSTAAGSRAQTPHSALYPNAVAFRDALHGELGTGRYACINKAWHCRLQGTISATSDAGKTWHVIRRTSRPVVAISFFHDVYYAEMSNGRVVSGQPGSRPFPLHCPGWYSAGYSANIVDRNVATPWRICLGEPGAGNEEKAVYRGNTRVAYTIAGKPYVGGIGMYGYPGGVAGWGSFGIIWESRGTLYISRDGGREWHALPKIAQPEVDFGSWATVLADRTGFVLLHRHSHSRLIETTDAGRTWHVVHRWR